MADQSVVSAAVTKYGTLAMTGVTKPPLYFDGIPQTNASGALLSTADGYVNLVDEGTTVQPSPEGGFDFEYNPVEVTTVQFEVYGPSLAYVDLVLWGIKYANGTSVPYDTTNGQKGFDFGTLTITGQQEMECRRLSEHRGRDPKAAETGKYVWRGEVRYSVQAKEN